MSRLVLSAPALLLLAGLAGLWTWVAGSRGFFPLDQSIVLDGAWRVHSGQIPFVDFSAAHGLSAYWLQALVFGVFGVSFSSLLLGATLLNAAAAILAVLALGRVLPRSPALAWIAGILTALWFQPPFGTPYPEQTAFFFCLLGLVLLLPPAVRRPRGRLVQVASAGVCLVLSFLAKQNAGFLFAGVLSLLLFRESRPRIWLAFGAGLALGVAAFLTWLLLVSDPAAFIHGYFGIPSGMLWPRLRQHFPYNLGWIVLGRGNWVPRVAFLACMALSLAYLCLDRRGRKDGEPGKRLAALLSLALLLYQNLFNVSSNNKPENAYAFAGLIAALALAIMPSLLARLQAPRSILVRVAGLSLVALLGGWGVHSAWSRRVHGVFRHSEFTGRIEAPGWEELRWAEPTPIRGADVRVEDLNALIAALRRRGRNFFVFPDFTFLYAMLGRPSPQPVLWFHWGLTYPARYDKSLDDWIVRDLRKHGVETIVLEDRSWMGTANQVGCFPELARFIETEFEASARYGMFRVLVRK